MKDRYGEELVEATITPITAGVKNVTPEPEPVTPTETGLAWLRSIRDQLLRTTDA